VSPVELFLCGFGGSAAAEVLVLHEYYLRRNARLPERYRKAGFWVVRFLLAVVGGGLAVFYNLSGPIPAIHVGVATPLIIQAFARTAPRR
jgi:hypothetical protein